MPKTFITQSSERISISDKPIANPGGEGAIFDVVGDEHPALVAKIYHTPHIAQSRQKKIEFMVANSPLEMAPDDVKSAIVWPVDTLYDAQGTFVGFTMPRINDSISLKALTLPGNPSRRHGAAWRKFDHDQPGSHQRRLVVAYNLAQAINAIHQRGDYVLVDLKPDNIFIEPKGSIAVIDMDSIQINNATQNFPAKVYTEEFAPPELHMGKVDHKSGQVSKAWDNFSLAVIIYELLLGIHPYQASHQHYTTRPELIQHGFFVHGKRKNELHVIPFVHNSFPKFHSDIRHLFMKTFDDGQTDTSKRATPQEWSDVILPVINLESTYNTRIETTSQLPQVRKPRSTAVKRVAKPGTPNSIQNLPPPPSNLPAKRPPRGGVPAVPGQTGPAIGVGIAMLAMAIATKSIFPLILGVFIAMSMARGKK